MSTPTSTTPARTIARQDQDQDRNPPHPKPPGMSWVPPILAFAGILLLCAVTILLLGGPTGISSLDHATAQWVAAMRSPGIIAAFVQITELGAARVVMPLLLAGAVLLWLLRRPWLIAPLLLSSIAATVMTQIGKLALQRPRPEAALLIVSSWSFPSGHATIAIAFYGFIVYLLLRSNRAWSGWRQRLTQVGLLTVSIALLLLIGMSRIVLGVHYLSDVGSGYLIGALWLIIAIAFSQWLTTTGRIDWYATIGPVRGRAAIALGLFTLLAALVYLSQWQPRWRPPPAPHDAILSISSAQPSHHQRMAMLRYP